MIVVVGSINMDMTLQVPSHPLRGEVVQGSDYTLHPGGRGANQAVAVARAGSAVRLIGKVGIDVFADTLLDSLAASGVDIHAVQRVARPSGVAFINVTADGETSITVSPGANAALQPQDLDAELFRDARVVLVQLEIPAETALHALALGQSAGAVNVMHLTPGHAFETTELHDVDVLIASREDAALLRGVPEQADPPALIEALHSYAPQVILTVGSDGVWWSSGNDQGHIDAFRVTPVDTTAASDAFAGAFAAALEGERPLADAARFGAAAAALAVLCEGAQEAMPHRESIEELLLDEEVAAGVSSGE